MQFDINNKKERLAAKNRFDGNLVYGAHRFHKETTRTGKGRPSSGYLPPAHAEVVTDTGTERFVRIDKFWEQVDQCPVCSCSESEHVMHRLGIDIFRCNGCNHRFQNPRINYHKIIELYSNESSHISIYNSQIQKELDHIKSEYGLSLVDQLSDLQRDKIMDIGCGSGGFLYEAKNQGWNDCVGVDINSNWSPNYKKNQEVQFINCTFEELSTKKVGHSYHLISMWNVLEHIYDLHDTLDRIYSLLADKGLFLIMVPNVESLASRLMRERSPTFNWKHVSHFCKNSLDQLLKSHNFKCIHSETVITEIDNVKSYMSGEHPYNGHGDPEHLFDFITPEYIHGNFLGSRILAIYQK